MVDVLWNEEFRFHFLDGFAGKCAVKRKDQAEFRRQHNRLSAWWHVWNAAMISEGPFRTAALNAGFIAWKRHLGEKA